jgi:pyroglutamyl-peptidase
MVIVRTIHSLVAMFALAGLFGCSDQDEGVSSTPSPAQKMRDEAPDGLYHDFLDGKYDGDGHPLDAQVWEAEAGCEARTGVPELEGLGLHASGHAAGVVCSAASTSLGRGRFMLNVRALVTEPMGSGGSFCEGDTPVLTVRVLGPSGNEVARKQVLRGAFEVPNVYQNLRIPVDQQEEGPVQVEVVWDGQVSARVDYVELFRTRRGVLLEPGSDTLVDDGRFEVEFRDPPDYAVLRVACDGVDVTPNLEALLASGEATRVDTEFRAHHSVPVGPLLQGCARPSRVMFHMVTGDWTRATSRVTVRDGDPACSFVEGTTRVLLTGFEPFPADATGDNVSEHAVTRFDATALAGVSAMALVLPVEFDSAANMMARVLSACAPDVVIGFGQGRSIVDLERVAYNRKDSATFSGGIPDNRGVVEEGTRVVEGGPDELHTGLPVEVIRQQLEADGIAVGFSDDPGRYVCNNLFYRLMSESQGTSRVAGFIHLPRISHIDEADAAMLQTVVRRAVEASVRAANGG